MSIQIREHAPGTDLRAFIDVQDVIYSDDPQWIAPLQLELRDRLTPGKNPFWDHAEGTLFTAYRDGKPVGRISAQIDYEHLRVHQDEAGFFGFFETIDDQEVANALLEKAQQWLASRGMKGHARPL